MAKVVVEDVEFDEVEQVLVVSARPPEGHQASLRSLREALPRL